MPATSISLGNFYTSNGKNLVGSSGGSGLDTKTIVDSLVGAREAANVTPLKTTLTDNGNKIAALSQMQTLMDNFKSSADLLRSVPGFGTQSQNAFDYVSTSVVSNTSVPGSDYIDVAAEPGATLQNYGIDSITHLAQASKQASGVFVISGTDQSVVSASSTAGMFTAGTVTIKGVAITLNTGDSLSEVAATFNASKTQTGISANIVQVSTGHYQLVFTATETGTANAFDISTANTKSQVTDASGVLTNVGIATTANGTAQNAEFSLDGVTITRSTNTISDAINGLNFTLKQTTPVATTLNVTISPDTATAESAIVNFMNSYNALKQFAANQTQLKSDGTYADTSYLRNDDVMNSALRSIQSFTNTIVAGLEGNTYNSLASIGITFTDVPATTDSTGKVTQAATSNVLTYDKTKLETALSSQFAQVAKLFEFTSTSTNPNLAVYSGPKSLPANNYIVTINPLTSTYQASYTDLDGDVQTIDLEATASGSGYSFAAPANSALAGLVLLYNSTSATSATVTATQGVGDKTYQYLNSVLQANTGSLALENTALTNSNQKTQALIDRQNSFLDTYRTQLLNQFAALEKAISKSNNILQSLYAQQVASLGANG